MLLGHEAASVLLSASMAGTVKAPAWLLPTAAAGMAAIPAGLAQIAKQMKNAEGKAQDDWRRIAPSIEESLFAADPQCVCVLDAGAKGAGLYSTQFVPKGTYLFDYTGELLSKTEYDARYPNKVSDYTAGIRDPTTGIMSFIDGRDEQLGTPARYMNHDGRRPNVGRRSYIVPDGEPRILMYSLRDIEPGDELQWNYGDGYWMARSAPVQE